MLVLSFVLMSVLTGSPQSPSVTTGSTAAESIKAPTPRRFSYPPFDQLDRADTVNVFLPRGTKATALGVLPEECRAKPDECVAPMSRVEFSAPFLRQLAGRPRTLVVGFSAGPSADPSFYLFDSTNSDATPILILPGATEIYITSEGTLYAIGGGNRFHEVRQKFTIKNGAFVEVQQPLYFVGRPHTVRESPHGPLVLRLAQAADAPAVATVLPGQRVEVLAAVGSSPDSAVEQWFLMRTEFGLVGYAKCTYGNFEALCGLDLPGD